MPRIGSQRGEGKAGCIFWILLAIGFGMVASRVIPVKIAAMQLEDFMEDQARTQPRQDAAYFRRAIAGRAEELGLEIPRDQIRVKKTTNRVIMDVQFTVPVDLFVTQHDWRIKIYLDRDIFLM